MESKKKWSSMESFIYTVVLEHNGYVKQNLPSNSRIWIYLFTITKNPERLYSLDKVAARIQC